MKETKKVSKSLYAILTILFGCIGVNKFYAGKIKAGILSLLFCWTLIPLILSIAEFITVLTIKADKNGKIDVSSQRITNVRFIVLLFVFCLFVIGSIIPWESLFTKFTLFSDLNKSLAEFKIFDYAIFSNIIGTPVVELQYGSSGVIPAIGSWQMLEVSILLIFISIIIAISSGIKFNELIASATNSIKKVLPIAITAMLLSIVLVVIVTTGLDITISKALIGISSNFNIATSSLGSIVGSVFSSDYYYFANRLASVYMALVSNSNYYGVIAFIMQSLFYTVMIIAPTSVGLVIGLYYLNIPYNKWLKYIWKVLLAVFAIVIIASIIIYAII